MTTDTALRDRLQSRADEQHISVASLQDITAAGDRSIRRTRVAGGLGVIVLAMVGLLGVVGLRSTDTPSTMFAGLDLPFDGAPATIIATEDGWLGAVVSFDADAPPTDSSGEIYLATSDDGESWQLAEPTGFMSTSSEIAIDEHDGRYWLAVTKDADAYLAFSDDLQDWTRVEIPVVTGADLEPVDGVEQVVSARTLVANPAGVMALFVSSTRPDFDYAREQLGIEPGQTCGYRWSITGFPAAGQLGLRICGDTEWQGYTVEGLDETSIEPDVSLVFSADGESFERIDLPVDDRAPLTSVVQNMYSTNTGFGLVDYSLIESTNGTDWATVDRDRSDLRQSETIFGPALAAAWDDQRLVAPMFNVGFAELQLRTDSGEWATHSLEQVLEFGPGDRDKSFLVRSIEAGEAGWAIMGLLSQTELISQQFSSEAAAVIVPVGNLELRATMPAGVAELVDAEGEVIASWDNFELFDLQRNEYVRMQEDEFTLLGVDGEPVAQDSLENTFNQIQLAEGPPLSVVLFSPDGENWTELHRSIDFMTGLVVGDDEVLVAQGSAQGLTSLRLPAEAD